MSVKLHQAVVAEASMVREELGRIDIGSFKVLICVSGRTLSDADECKIEYTVEGGWSDPSVKGNTIENCLAEFKRRKEWEVRNAPLALAKPRPKVVPIDSALEAE